MIMNQAQYWTTQEGMKVSFIEATHLPMVDIQLAFDAGSSRDGSGISYLTNNMLIKGAAQWSTDEIVERLDGLGAQLNTASYSELSLIHLRSLSDPEYFVPALNILKIILKAPNFLEKDFHQEQAQLLIELQEQEQQPEEIARKAFYEALYEGHLYANWLYGDQDSVKKISVQDVKFFYKKYYLANNSVLSIVGDVSVDQAKEIANNLSNSLPVGSLPDRMIPVPKLTAKNKTIDFPSDQTHLIMGLPILKQNDPDFFSLVVGNHILGANGMVNRLFKEIRENRGFAYEVGSYFIPLREAGPFVIGLQTKNEQVNEAVKIVKQLLSDFIDNGPTAEELEAAKLNLLGSYVLKFDTNKSILDYLMILRFYQLPLDYFDQYQKNIADVSLESIRDAFKRRIDPELISIIKVGRIPDAIK